MTKSNFKKSIMTSF